MSSVYKIFVVKYFKDGKEVMKYQAGRDVDSLLQFIKRWVRLPMKNTLFNTFD